MEMKSDRKYHNGNAVFQLFPVSSDECLCLQQQAGSPHGCSSPDNLLLVQVQLIRLSRPVLE